MPLTAGPPPVKEIVHGVLVHDPYRWLEDGSRDETREWIREQQRLCESYFSACPGLPMLERRVREYLDVEILDQPARVANRYFYRKRRKGEEQPSIYVRDIATEKERLLVDPSSAGPFTSVGIYRISEGGTLLAFEVQRGGEGRKEIHIVDVERSKILPDSIPLGYARGLAFTIEEDGYLYCQDADGAAVEDTIRLHHFGESGEDEILLRVPRHQDTRLALTANAQWFGAIWVRPRGAERVANFWIRPRIAGGDWLEVLAEKRLPYNPFLCHEKIFAFVEAAPGVLRLIELSTGGDELRTLIPEIHGSLRQHVVTRDRISIASQVRGGLRVDSWDFGGQMVTSPDLPIDGTVQILPGHTQQADGLFYSYESFERPLVIYEYDTITSRSTLWHEREPISRAGRCNVCEASVLSRDGTAIPLTLVECADKPSCGPAPVIMTSYGGFGVAMTPQFSVLVSVMMELGAIFALPHIRGGGEFGQAWHDAGRARKRQAAIDDFLAVADWLCKQGVTTSSRLGIFGGSNSGLLVGAAMTQRPELFSAVLCIAPLLDMVRYERFDQAAKWRLEYGTVEDPEDFCALYAYSPYHRIQDHINYPATMFVSGDKDDRCNPAHVRKMSALLQKRAVQESPVIVDYSEERGHSPTLPLSVRVAALARRIVFLCRELQIPSSDGGTNEAPRG